MSKVAIIGTGIAGMGAAHFLQKKYDITLFEQNNYVGGHTNTVMVKEGDASLPIDTGFIVFNYQTYPHLCNLFKELGVEVKKTDMSFGVQYIPTDLEYCGSSLNHLFAQRKNILNPSYIRFLLQINRFNQESIEVLESTAYQNMSVKEYTELKGYSKDFTLKYLLPMTSALWSTPTDVSLTFPILSLVRFFKNHGFLGLNTQFQWYTVEHGSHQYRDKLITPFKNKIYVNAKVAGVKRNLDHIDIVLENGEKHHFDKVIFACHADQALEILGNDSTILEKRLLSPFKYQKNIATLHTDASVMPKNKLCWAAWNYRIDQIDGETIPHCVYYMNRLQGISDKVDYFLSINDPGLVAESKKLKTIYYEHPVFTVEAMHAQRHLQMLNEEDNNTYFCGSYFKYGFHEDALASAVEMSKKLVEIPVWT